MYAVHLTYKDKTTVIHTERMKTVLELWEENSHGVQVFEVVKALPAYGYAEYRLLPHEELIEMLFGKIQVA